MNSPPYAEAATFVSAHSREVSGWENFTTHARWSSPFTPAFFALLVSLFAGCAALLWWAGGATAQHDMPVFRIR